MRQEYIDILIRSSVYGFFACASGLIGKFWYNSRKKSDATIEHLTSERDKGLDRENALRVELEICRYTYIECYAYLQTVSGVAKVIHEQLRTLDPTTILNLPDTSALPRSLNQHMENLLKQQGGNDDTSNSCKLVDDTIQRL